MNKEVQFAIGESSLGSILVASSEKGLCAIFIDDDVDTLIGHLQERFPHAHLINGNNQFKILMKKVINFIEAPSLTFDVPLDIQGTTFQQRVWQALKKIPLGITASYSEVAKQIGSPKAVRAVASACAANALAVVIPCHRVIRNDGSLSGYRWGMDKKKILLERESNQ